MNNVSLTDDSEKSSTSQHVFVDSPCAYVDCPNWWDCCETWNGATDIDNEGNFTWNHRTAVDFTNWNEDQPDNFLEESSGDEDGQHCAAFCRNGFWDDNECSKKKTFICEKEHT
ncbi:perlucin-like [Saccostrea cucullata]|uniref:perlucin-like n=1 Tax=Saccostrea cuccullata TaxID=36930 RepID=UPI002ED4C719